MRPQDNAAESLFHQGKNYKAYEYFGAHLCSDVCVFRVWAPNADSVFVVGDFCNWDEGLPMERISHGGIWECTVRDRVNIGDKYKYKILNSDKVLYKSDPYATLLEASPNAASVICSTEGYKWRDSGWLSYRSSKAGRAYGEPMNIYEVCLGAWKRHEGGEPYTYSEIAGELAPYVKQMGYTHVELLSISENMNGDPWGCHTASYYAPPSLYGAPTELMGFVDSMHEAGIGVILDWTPAIFSSEESGISRFDGQPLYEHCDTDSEEYGNWSTGRFDLSKNEVQCFIASNACYWFDKYHIDGLIIGSVASMLCDDVGQNDNPSEQMVFLKKLNGYIRKMYPDVLMIAGEAAGIPNITSTEEQGLGFDMMWNRGWMSDIMAYAGIDPLFRKYDHEKTTFSLTYAFNERYVLPIPRDELICGKRSFIDKMHGDYWQKFASVRAFLGYSMTHPGKKLTFMGTEIGQFKEACFSEQLEWFLLDYDMHAKLQRYVSELNQMYLRTPALWQLDGSWDGFQWIEPNNRNHSIISYRRMDNAKNEVIILINFTPVAYEDYRLGVPDAGLYREIFNSDGELFGGSGVVNRDDMKSESKPWNYCENSIVMRVPPLAVTILRCVGKTSSKRKTVTTSSTKRKIIKNKTSGGYYVQEQRMRSNAIGRRTGKPSVCPHGEKCQTCGTLWG